MWFLINVVPKLHIQSGTHFKTCPITMYFLVFSEFLSLSLIFFFLFRWQKTASYLCATIMEPTDLRNHIDSGVLWRGALVIREKTVGVLDQE